MSKNRAKGTGTITYNRQKRLWYGRYDAGYTESGKRRRRTVTAHTKKECQAKLAEAIEAFNTQTVGGARVEHTVKSWLDVWMEEKRHTMRPSTWHTYERVFRCNVTCVIGHVYISELTADDIRAIHAHMRAKNLSPTSLHRVQQYLQQALKDAVIEGYEVPQAVLLMRRPRKAQNIRAAIPLDDARRMAATATTMRGSGELDRHDGSRWLAAILCGLRQGEALGVRWQDVDFDNNVFYVTNQLQAIPYLDRQQGVFDVPDDFKGVHLVAQYHLVPPKTAHGVRVVPLVGQMREALLAWRAVWPGNPWDLVWARDKNMMPAEKQWDTRCWRALQDACGVRKPDGNYYMVHEGRNTAATLLLEAGADPIAVTAILGHTTIDTSRSYMRVTAEHTMRALGGAAEILEGAA